MTPFIAPLLALAAQVEAPAPAREALARPEPVPSTATAETEPRSVSDGSLRPAYLWQDFDRDGLRDVYVLRAHAVDQLLRNRGDGFEDVTETVGLSGITGTLAVEWTDFEADGLPDLYLVEADGRSRLFHNVGPSFVDVTATSGVGHDEPALLHEWIDEDHDRLPDLHVVGVTTDVLFENLGGGRFQPVALPTGGVGVEAFVRAGGLSGFRAGAGDPARSAGAARADRPRSGRGSASRSLPRVGTDGPGSEFLGICGTLDIDDQGAAGCLQASSVPTLGMLYPLSTDLNVDGSGNVGVGTTAPTAKLDVDGLIRSRSGGIEFPDATVQTTAQVAGPQGPAGPPGSGIAGSGFASGGNTVMPGPTLEFLSPPVTVTVTGGQKVFVAASRAFGSRWQAGACCLSLWLGYRPTAGSFSLVGTGMIGNKVNRNTRTVMSTNGVITGLADGTYEVGMVGGTGDTHWDFNGAGYTSALVFD